MSLTASAARWWVGPWVLGCGARLAGAAEPGGAAAAHDWILGVLALVVIAQTLVLGLVLLRLNRLLKSMGTIGRRLHETRLASHAIAGEPAKPTRIATTTEPAMAFERTRIMPAMGGIKGPAAFTNDLGMKFIQIPAGEFTMGSADPDSPDNERPAHKVRLTQPFWMAQTPVTDTQYEQFDPDHRKRRPAWSRDDHPVVCASWSEATAFCLWLSQRDGREYRLPTEAQWEYAARGADERVFPWGSFWDPKRCNSADESAGVSQTTPVKQFAEGASPFGILDMVGNVWEWCADWFAPSYGSDAPQGDPAGPPSGKDRACRGGSWMNHAYSCRTTMRARRPPDFSDNYIGFRVVCVSAPDAAAAPPKTGG
ncbi:MAG: formylglycine-generating enzyme family protein [Verrucomicrobia bacterium]|nr:formylglycine-generating enzyme family protein [Verrucomicrobiota bacterium]